MARTTRQLSGAGKDKFLRSAIARAVAASPDPAAVADALAREITEIRVRREAWEASLASPPQAIAPSPADQSPPGHGSGLPTSLQEAPGSPGPDPGATPAGPAAPAAAFDPFAFSAVALLTRKGRSGLAQALDGISQVEDLRRLAEAQHLVLPEGLADVSLLREAVIAAAERRIAERRAAAS